MHLFGSKITDIPAYNALLFSVFDSHPQIYFILQENFKVLTFWNVSFSVAAIAMVQCVVIQ
jgi:hypothetical protein